MQERDFFAKKLEEAEAEVAAKLEESTRLLKEGKITLE